MASAENVLAALALAERALREVRPDPSEPGANQLLLLIDTLKDSVASLRDLATKRVPSKTNPRQDRALGSILAAIGALTTPNNHAARLAAMKDGTEELRDALEEMRLALGDPTTDPNG